MPDPEAPVPILRAEGITAGYRPDLPILKEVSVEVATGKITVIIGPNGAGKSTLIKAIAGLVSASAGRVILNGSDISGLRPDQMHGVGMAYVPQTDNIFRSLTVRHNLDLALRASGREAGERRMGLETRFPMLAEKATIRAGALSGGQRQVLAIAMALAVEPSVLMLDEPSAGLSPKAAAEVLDLLRDLAGQGVTILLVEQNVKQALRLADHCYILADGRNQLDGPAADLIADPVVGEIYLGGRRMAS